MEMIGTSTTGTKHGLMVDVDEDSSSIRFCITGVGGKRHATVWLSLTQANEVADLIKTARMNARKAAKDQ